MKILKNTLIVSSYVLLVALFFGGGYAIGRIGVSDSVPTPMPTVAAVEEVNANDVKTTVYEVKVENGLLQINKCVGNNKTAILSEEISENGDVALQSDTETESGKFLSQRMQCLQSLLDIPMHGCTQRNLCQLLRLPEQLP